MSIMDQFRNFLAPANMPQVQQTQQGQLPNQQPLMQSGPNAFVPVNTPNTQVQTQEVVKEEPPLVDYKDLFKVDTPKPGEDIFAPLTFNIDPAKVKAYTAQTDYTKVLSPELLEKIGKGDTASILAAMNAMVQEARSDASIDSAKVTQAAIEAGSSRVRSQMPTIIKQHSVRDALKGDNPLFSNPATAPMLDNLATQFQQKFPNATTLEIQQHVKGYLTEVANEINKNNIDPNAPKLDNQGKPVAKEFDWSAIPIEP